MAVALEEKISEDSQGRPLSKEEFVDVVTTAELLYYDQGKTNQALVERLKGADSSALTLSDAYDYADEQGIPKEYINRALRVLPPTFEQKMEDIENCGAELTEETKFKIILRSLMEALRGKYPEKSFNKSNFHGYDSKYEIWETWTTEEPYFRFWRRTVSNRRRLAFISSSSEITRVWIDDESFTRACCDTLNELKERFGPEREIEIMIEYDPAK